MRLLPTQAWTWLAFPGLALASALVSNAFASKARRLAWTEAPPEAARVLAPVPAPPPERTAPAEVAPEPAARAAPTPAQASVQTPAPVQAPADRARARFPLQPDAVTREIGSQEALEAHRMGIPFLDARRSADFAQGHVAGAFPVPVWESDAAERLMAFEAAKPWPPQAPLVLYCGGGDCEDSHLLAARLVALGYRNLLLYRAGWPDWIAQGRPSGKGTP